MLWPPAPLWPLDPFWRGTAAAFEGVEVAVVVATDELEVLLMACAVADNPLGPLLVVGATP